MRLLGSPGLDQRRLFLVRCLQLVSEPPVYLRTTNAAGHLEGLE
jgi:hypothetical protein